MSRRLKALRESLMSDLLNKRGEFEAVLTKFIQYIDDEIPRFMVWFDDEWVIKVKKEDDVYPEDVSAWELKNFCVPRPKSSEECEFYAKEFSRRNYEDICEDVVANVYFDVWEDDFDVWEDEV